MTLIDDARTMLAHLLTMGEAEKVILRPDGKRAREVTAQIERTEEVDGGARRPRVVVRVANDRIDGLAIDEADLAAFRVEVALRKGADRVSRPAADIRQVGGFVEVVVM